MLGRLAFLKGKNSPRKIITLESEKSLARFAELYPELGRGFLKAIRRLGPMVKKIYFPAVLSEFQNRDIIVRFNTDHQFARSLIRDGILELNKAGIKINPIHIERASPYKPVSIEDYCEMLDEHFEEFKSDAEVGNLFLFKALLRVRIDLYKAGEERSARKFAGAPVKMTPELQRIKSFLDYLIEKFPFDKPPERKSMEDGIKKASSRLSQQNNPAADLALASKTDFLVRILNRQMLKRIRNPRRAKVRYAGKGIWEIRQSGYKKTKSGLLRKAEKVKRVQTAKLLSMLSHEIDSFTEELIKNEGFLKEMESIQEALPDFWDKLYEMHDIFKEYGAFIKEKACAEIEGALELIPIPSKNDQALRLAKSLLSLAQSDLKYRQEEVQAQKQRFIALIPEAEEKIGQELEKFANQVCRVLANPQITSQAKLFVNIDRRLGGILGTFFKDKMREEWLKRAKSRVVGVKRALSQIRTELQKKAQSMALIKNERERFLEEKRGILMPGMSPERKNQALLILEREVLENVRDELKKLAEINDKLVKELVKAGEHILLMIMDYKNREEELFNRDEFLLSKHDALEGIRQLNSDQVEVLSVKGKGLGRILRSDAQAMGLRFREVSGT
ncbi:MAG: hypothetical protein V3T21_04870 [Candidatus Margulisiibacteriota bacterium]